MRAIIRAVAVLLPVLALCIQPTSGFAHERPTGKALVFGVGSSFSINSFNGGTVAYQQYLRDDLAWRLTLEVGLDRDDTTFTGEYESDFTDAYSEPDEEWDYSISLCSEWLTYRGSKVALYYGGGPRAAYTNTLDSYEIFDFWDEGVRVYRTEYYDRSLHLGITGVLGVQWTPASWCSLHAEYRVVAGYVSEVDGRLHEDVWPDGEGTRDDVQTTQGIEFDSLDVSVGLSIYF